MKDNGGPAFPRACSEDRVSGDQPDGNSTVSEQDGMSLRDWFAGQALAGYLAAHADTEVSFPSDEDAASSAYEYADAMLKARAAK